VVICVIVVKPNGGAEELARAIRKFKHKVEDDSLLEEVRERQYYRKPSLIKHEKLQLRKYYAKRRKNQK